MAVIDVPGYEWRSTIYQTQLGETQLGETGCNDKSTPFKVETHNDQLGRHAFDIHITQVANTQCVVIG